MFLIFLLFDINLFLFKTVENHLLVEILGKTKKRLPICQTELKLQFVQIKDNNIVNQLSEKEIPTKRQIRQITAPKKSDPYSILLGSIKIGIYDSSPVTQKLH